jgi:diguanylate cyclase (GGDEF)-like protein/PAS domain S-box-containing protein
LKASEDHYRLLADNSNDVIWTMDLDGHFSYVSPAVERLRGFTPAEVLDQTFDEVICPGSRLIITDRIQRAIQMALAGNSVIPPEYIEIEQPCKDGSTVWTEASAQLIFNERHEPIGFVGISRDIRERKQAEQQLKHDATHDALTGLPNRVLLMKHLEISIEINLQKPDYTFAVLFLDIDEFKIINDSLGHAYGDHLLITIGNRLKNCIRPCDTITRLGGDEFVILLRNIKDIDEVKSIAARILEEIQQPYQLDTHRVFISASIGIIPSLSGYSKAEEILRDADISMYRAKALGKARYEIFEPLLLNKAITRLEIEHEIRQAIESGKFRLLYQPIFSLAEKEIVGFEALLRLEDSINSLSLPPELISIAEETGLIGTIGKWVLHEACSQIKRWQVVHPQFHQIHMSVNISSKQFSQPDFIEQITKVLEETGLTAANLTLEITESVFIGNSSKAKSVFSALCELGVQLHIDDFGTGYSSLRYIKHFPIGTIKIDQSFVKEIHTSSKDADLVHSIVLMAHSLGMETIAEGIENQAQLDQLLKYGCHYGQGFFLSKPIDSRAVELLVAKIQTDSDIRIHKEVME